MNPPELLYDGECGFCVWWVRYWQRLTGSAVAFTAWQDALGRYPQIEAHHARGAIQFIDRDGTISTGAAAAFSVLAVAGAPLWLWLYRHSRAFAAVSEKAYRGVARRREYAATIARALWGAERYPATYATAGQVFLRLLGLAYGAAFVSFGLQVEGLAGVNGILPAERYFAAFGDYYGATAWLRLPSLFWFNAGNPALVAACVVGACAAALVVVVPRHARLSLLICFALYLSLFAAGQDFMHFQWDLLLLEAGFLALFLPSQQPLVAFLFRVLLFKFMLLSGLVKLLSGDPSWAALSALDVHFETQPLPTPLAWYAHHLPAWIKHAGVAATLVIELALPPLVFFARRPRMLAAAGFIGLELLIALTGNYNFFNFLTLALVVFLFDDAQLGRFRSAINKSSPRRAYALLTRIVCIVLLLLNAEILLRQVWPQTVPAWTQTAVGWIQPWRICNSYGLFANMTTTRPEIEIEASRDGREWLPYRFRHKPGDPAVAAGWLVPHQPRLDWQMWFAALSDASRTSWFANLLYRLLQAEPDVLALFGSAPLGAERPHLVRARLYVYRFSSPAERSATGELWQRRSAGLYYPAVALP